MSCMPFIGPFNGAEAAVTPSEDGGGEPITGIDFSGKTLPIMGDSIVFGVATTSNELRWTSRFCTGVGATEDNLGVSGMTMQNFSVGCGNIPFDKTTIPAYVEGTHSALIIAFGTNDVGFNVAESTSDAFYTRYAEAVIYAITVRLWPPELIILLNIYKPFSWNTYVGACSVTVAADTTRVSDFQSKISQVATENGCWYIDIYTAMNGLDSSYFNADELHPNDTGHAFIADWLIDNL